MDVEEQKTSHLQKHIWAVQFLEHARERKVLSQMASFDFQPPKSRSLLTGHLEAAYNDVHSKGSAWAPGSQEGHSLMARLGGEELTAHFQQRLL